MKVFITGGSGLVGAALCRALLERGDEVVCLSRDPGRAAARLPEGVELVGGDPCLPGMWQDRLGRCDAVVNLAGASVADGRWTGSRKAELRRSRLGATDNVVQALAEHDTPRVLVSASAVGYYGDRGDQALAETAAPGDGFLARLAVEWENTAVRARGHGARVVPVRIGVVLAADGGALPRMVAPYRWGMGGPLGSGRQYLPWVHLADLIRILLFVLDHDSLDEPVNAVAPDPPTQGEFARTLGTVLGKPARLPAPAIALRLLLGEQAQLVLSGQRAVPYALKAAGFRFTFDGVEDALRDLLD